MLSRLLAYIHGIIDAIMVIWAVIMTYAFYREVKKEVESDKSMPHNGHERRVYGNS